MELLIRKLEDEAKALHAKSPGVRSGPFTGDELALVQRELEHHADQGLHYLLTEGFSLISFSTREWLVEMWRWTDKSTEIRDYLPLTLWPDWCKKEGLTG